MMFLCTVISNLKIREESIHGKYIEEMRYLLHKKIHAFWLLFSKLTFSRQK